MKIYTYPVAVIGENFIKIFYFLDIFNKKTSFLSAIRSSPLIISLLSIVIKIFYNCNFLGATKGRNQAVMGPPNRRTKLIF